jgi:hypothetical protein
MWLTFRRRHVSPDYRDAHAHDQVRASGSATAQTGNYVPADRVSALDGLTVPHRPANAADNQAGRAWAEPESGNPCISLLGLPVDGQRPSARWSWALFIDDRPSTFRRRASAYSWA